MTFGPAWSAAPVLWPLLAAVATLLWGRRPPRTLVLAAALGLPVLLVPVTIRVLVSGPVRHAVGGWGAPLGIELVADGLAVAMLWLTALVGLALSVHATGYFQAKAARTFWPLWFLLLAGLCALFLAGDLFNAYVTLELVTLTAVPLVTLGHGAARPAVRYLLLALLGSLGYLIGVALLYGIHGVLDLAALRGLPLSNPSSALGLALITAGLLLKAAVFPFHVWLPPAHAAAPAPVSAALSALVVEASAYLLLRVWYGAVPGPSPAAATVLGALGGAAVVYGALQAARQRRLKLLVAWSTVAQLGYVLLVFPLAGRLAWDGAAFQLLAHGLAKAAAFLAAGNVLAAAAHDRIADLHASPQVRGSLFVFGLAGVSLLGLPPTGGFAAKWRLLSAALATGGWGWVAILATGGLLASVYLFRVLRQAVLAGEAEGEETHDAPPGAVTVPTSPAGAVTAPTAAPPATPPAVSALPRSLTAPPLLLALAAWLLGLLAEPVGRLLAVGAPTFFGGTP